MCFLFSCQHRRRNESFNHQNRVVGHAGVAMPAHGFRHLQVQEGSCHQSKENKRKAGETSQRNQQCSGKEIY